MKVAELRKKFTSYFSAKDHLVQPSSSLLPAGDPTLLFTSAGMVPFKEYFSAEKKPPHPRLATVQKCMRTTDLEAVGKTLRHLSFFEMLGNFSFGNYFKKEAIEFAWDFSLQELNFPKEQIWISIFQDDDEAYDLWHNHIGVPAERIVRLGREDNFWGPAGSTGACGPCSELYLDRGPAFGSGPENSGPGGEGERFLEYWNLVFNQFFYDGNVYQNLQQTGIDTGAGLERLASLLQDVESVYDTDELKQLSKDVAIAFGVADKFLEHITPLRVLTDHIRTLVFSIADGIYPSNESRGYVLRRVLRRALMFGRQLGQTKPLLHSLVDKVIGIYVPFYPELKTAQSLATSFIQAEEQRFLRTLDEGLTRLDELLESCKKKNTDLSGKDAFILHDTYGFPIELTTEVAENQNIRLDTKGYLHAMESQRERGRKAFKQGAKEIDTAGMESVFEGYEQIEAKAKVIGLYVGNKLVQELQETDFSEQGCYLVTDRTCFYPEGGGQLGDQGFIKSEGFQALIIDTQQVGQAIIHQLEKLEGSVKVGLEVELSLDREKRNSLKQHHSATHLLNAALRKELGSHVRQSGSLVHTDYLRFDFTNPSSLSKDQIISVQEEINRNIEGKIAVNTEVLPIEQAKERGAVMTFGEKYGEVVRVVAMGDASIEFCGGTHVENTDEIKFFLLTRESSPGAGNRRIEARCGSAALNYYQDKILELNLGLDTIDKIETTKEAKGIRQSLAELSEQPISLSNWLLLDSFSEKVSALEKSTKKNQKKKQGKEFLLDGEELEAIIQSAADGIGQKAIPGAGIPQLKSVADQLRDRNARQVYILWSKSQAQFIAVLASSKDFIGEKGASLNDLLKLQIENSNLPLSGGGKPELVQVVSKGEVNENDFLTFVNSLAAEVRNKIK